MYEKVIYIRIPRCAGTTFRKYFKSIGIYNRVGKGVFRYNKKFIDFYCDSLEQNLSNKEKLGEIWNSSYKFAVIRNPVSKFFSSFYYCKQQDPVLFNIEINDFIENFSKLQLNEFSIKHILRLQTNHLIQDCNKLVRLENFSTDIQDIFKILNIEKNRLKKYNYKRYVIPEKIDKNIANFIKEYFYDDFVKLNYTYDF